MIPPSVMYQAPWWAEECITDAKASLQLQASWSTVASLQGTEHVYQTLIANKHENGNSSGQRVDAGQLFQGERRSRDRRPMLFRGEQRCW
jgi:hypothetical protein